MTGLYSYAQRRLRAVCDSRAACRDRPPRRLRGAASGRAGGAHGAADAALVRDDWPKLLRRNTVLFRLCSNGILLLGFDFSLHGSLKRIFKIAFVPMPFFQNELLFT